MIVVGTTDNASDEEHGNTPKAPSSALPRIVNRFSGGCKSNIRSGMGDRAKNPVTQTSPEKIPIPKRRSAEDTYFDRGMCRFYSGQDYIQDDVTVSGTLVPFWTSCAESARIRRGSYQLISYGFGGKGHRKFSSAILLPRAESAIAEGISTR